MDPDEKTCPFCAERIKAAAIRCKHCHAELTTDDRRTTDEPTLDSRLSALDSQEVSDLLSTLVDRSLVAVDSATGRFRLLETVRQYALDRMVESEEGDDRRNRHMAYFVGLVDEAAPQVFGADQQGWLERLEAEHDNLRAALAWSAQSPGKGEVGQRLCGALCRFWLVRGHFAEGRACCTTALSLASGAASSARAGALNAAGVLAAQQGDYVAGRAFYEESLEIRRNVGDSCDVAKSLGNLANVAREQGDHSCARTLVEESLAIFRDQGDRSGIALSLNNLGNIAREQGDYVAARSIYEESLAILRVQGDRWGIASSLSNLGNVAYEQGDYAEARALFEECIAIQRDLGHRGGIAESLEGLAQLAAKRDRRAGAQLWGAAERLREEMGAPLSPYDRKRFDRQVAAVRAELVDDSAFDAAWREGRAMTMEQAIQLALDSPAAPV